MSETDAAPRPRQLTTTAGFVIGGSALLVLAVFDAMGNLQSVDTRDSVSQALGTTSGVGLGVDDVLGIMRVGLFVAGVCAAVAVVLGIYVLQRHRTARTVLGVLAVPILLTAPLTGSLLGAIVAASIAMLWSGPARDWFAGRPVRQPATPEPVQRTEVPVEQQPRREPSAFSVGTTSTTPPATSGYGESRVGAPPPATEAPPVFTDPRWVPPPAYPLPPQRIATPGGVRTACIVTWVCAAAVSVLCVMALLVSAGNRDVFLQQVRDNPALAESGLTVDQLMSVLWVVGVGMVLWSAGAAVLAWFVWRRHDWARWLLVVSAGAVFLAAIFSFPVGMPLQIASAICIVLLVGRPAREWFSETPQQRPPSQGRQLW